MESALVFFLSRARKEKSARFGLERPLEVGRSFKKSERRVFSHTHTHTHTCRFEPVLRAARALNARGGATVIGGDLNTHKCRVENPLDLINFFEKRTSDDEVESRARIEARRVTRCGRGVYLCRHNHGLVRMMPGMTGDDYFLSRLWRTGALDDDWSQTEVPPRSPLPLRIPERAVSANKMGRRKWVVPRGKVARQRESAPCFSSFKTEHKKHLNATRAGDHGAARARHSAPPPREHDDDVFQEDQVFSLKGKHLQPPSV